MSLIYHITPAATWAEFDGEPIYAADSLQSEGFIHLSEREQVAGVLDRYYRNVPDLLLLHIDPVKLIHELRYEEAPNGERFPHVYGPINRDAVVDVEHLKSEKVKK